MISGCCYCYDCFVGTACREDRFDIFAPIDYFLGTSGISTPAMYRNNAHMHSFIREHIAYADKGFYALSDQVPFNHLLLRDIAQSQNRTLPDALRRFERGEACDMFIPDEYYKYKTEHFKEWWHSLTSSSSCFKKYFHDWYGFADKKKITAQSRGRQDTSVCIFDDTEENGGQNWNARWVERAFKYKHLMLHVVGKKNFPALQDLYRKVYRRSFPKQYHKIFNQTKSAMFDTCVKQFQK